MAITTGDAVVSVRLDTDVLQQLDELAAEMDRSRSYLISEAVGEFVEREYAHLLHVREGEADIDADRTFTGEQMRVWLDELKAGRPGQGRSKRRSR